MILLLWLEHVVSRQRIADQSDRRTLILDILIGKSVDPFTKHIRQNMPLLL